MNPDEDNDFKISIDNQVLDMPLVTIEDVNEEEIKDILVPQYPFTLEFNPEELEMASYAGVVRKTKCWKDIVKENALKYNQFLESIKEEFPEVVKIRMSANVFEYFKDKLLNTDFFKTWITIDEELEDDTLILESE